jgi:hypothetical protein
MDPHARDETIGDLVMVDLAARQLPHLSAREVHDRVEGVLAYLCDDVLRRAHVEEVALFPLLEHAGAGSAESPFHAEHDTVREATAHLGSLAQSDMTPATVTALSGLLDGIHLMLVSHFARESRAFEPLLDDLSPHERTRVIHRLTTST